MSQGPLCPNLTQKVQKEVSQMANRNLPCKLKPPKNVEYLHDNFESGRSSSIILRLILHLKEHFYVQNLEFV